MTEPPLPSGSTFNEGQPASQEPTGDHGDGLRSVEPGQPRDEVRPEPDGDPVEFVMVGRVIKPHGIRGEVVVQVLSDVPDRLAAGVAVLLGGEPVTVTSSRPHQGRVLVGFHGVTDRSAAEVLRGRTIEAARIDLDDHDTYFAHELVGLPVAGESGEPLGIVVSLIELPDAAGYDLLEVRRDDATTWLLPAVDDYVEVEELDGGGLRLRLVDAPAGLVDIDVTAETDLDPDAAVDTSQ